MSYDTTAARFCSCDQHAPSLRVIRAPGFCVKLAAYVSELNLSAEGSIDWVLTELFDHRTGRLFLADGTQLSVDDNPDLTDGLFGADGRRSMNRFLDRTKRHFRYRLQERLVPTVTIMHFARESHLCRTSGCCAPR